MYSSRAKGLKFRHSTSSQSRVSQPVSTVPSLIVTCEICGEQVSARAGFPIAFRSHPVSLFPSMLHTYPHPHAALSWSTNGRCLGNFQKKCYIHIYCFKKLEIFKENQSGRVSGFRVTNTHSWDWWKQFVTMVMFLANTRLLNLLAAELLLFLILAHPV